MGRESENENDEIESRRDDALRRALSTPPKQHKDMKKGVRKKKERQDEDRPTAFSEKND